MAFLIKPRGNILICNLLFNRALRLSRQASCLQPPRRPRLCPVLRTRPPPHPWTPGHPVSRTLAIFTCTPASLSPQPPSDPRRITFLATLFLLLFISCTIVLRSFIIRRRFQRQIDEALAAGIILAPRAQGSRKRRYGHKPKFHTSWVAQGGEKWDEMMV